MRRLVRDIRDTAAPEVVPSRPDTEPAPAYTCALRGVLPAGFDLGAVLAEVENTHDDVWISRSTRCSRHTLRGVPGKRVDLVIDQRLHPEAVARVGVGDLVLVVEVGVKRGKFDGSERDRIQVRAFRPADARRLGLGRLSIERTNTSVTVCAVGADGDGVVAIWGRSYDVLSSDLDGYCLPRIVMWHFRRYFSHLAGSIEDVRGLADSLHWCTDGEGHSWADADGNVLPDAEGRAPTLAEANRAASRALYRLSRDLGWRKLTAREREKLCLVGEGQWHRDEEVARAWARRERCAFWPEK